MPQALPSAVVDEHITSQGIGPPPVGESVKEESEQDRGGKEPVDEGDHALGAQDGIAECSSGSRLAGGEGEHDHGGQSGPDDPDRAGAGMKAEDEDYAGLDQQVDGEQGERDADKTKRSPAPSLPGP
jgi:hypothetical protein